MTMLTVALSDEYSKRLQEIAERSGLTPEEFARISLEQWLARPDEEFERVSRYVFEKNAELYRRLA
jgi:predicted transcriptional regulator